MQKVNIPKFRKEVLAVIESNRALITSIDAKEDDSMITFCGKNYICEITLNDKWIGYDINITTPEGTAGCSLRNDTDVYPIYGGENERAALAVYDDLLNTIKAIFNGHVYYLTNDCFSYTAKKNNDGTYTVGYWERKKFLFWPYSSGWHDEKYSAVNFKKLKLDTLS